MSAVVEAHRAAGREFEAGGIRSFVREEGDGDPVVLMHGVPSSCFLYRKVVGELAARGLRGIAFDLPGLGLAERPKEFDYTSTGLGTWSLAAVDALGLDRFHLVVHDIGGPVGFEVAGLAPERVRSLTLLNTMVDVADYRRPWFMDAFALRGIGELSLRTMVKPAFAELLWREGVEDRSALPREEAYAWVDLLKGDDGGRAFLRVMRGFERTPAKQILYRTVAGDERYARQVVWGAEDPVLRLATHGEIAREAAGVDEIHALPAKHFLQEDQAPAVAERIAELAAEAA